MQRCGPHLQTCLCLGRVRTCNFIEVSARRSSAFHVFCKREEDLGSDMGTGIDEDDEACRLNEEGALGSSMARNPCTKSRSSKSCISFSSFVAGTDPRCTCLLSLLNFSTGPRQGGQVSHSSSPSASSLLACLACRECSGAALKIFPPCTFQITVDTPDSRGSADTVLAGLSRWRRAVSLPEFHNSSASGTHRSSNHCLCKRLKCHPVQSVRFRPKNHCVGK